MFLCILVLRRIRVLERPDGVGDERGLPRTPSCVAQLGLGSGLLGQLIFEPALELREVALERRDRRFRARRAKLGSQRRQIHRMGLMLGLQLLLKCGNRCPQLADLLVLGLDIHG